ncbi:class I SAM-dependent methyltransferase, partial [Hydrogenobaculum acidophilum]
MPIDDTFYRAFEEKFRGSEEEIKKRLEFYIPLLKVYAEAYPSSKPKALDIGCGRGEMLSIYEDYGFEAFGIDINKVVLEETRSKGFNVAYADALDFLKSQKQDTYDVISLIHVLEHLPFEYAFELHKEVLRVLKPGGTYIAEFPFAENLTVGTIGFWTDPTHLKPLHPETVAFSLSYLGFTETLYFGVNGGVKDLKDAALTDIITNYVAPDVVVVGIKPTENRFFIEKIKTALDYLKSKSSYRLWDILTSASNNIEKRIKEDIENLILSNNLE